jgi:hypothetical protein
MKKFLRIDDFGAGCFGLVAAAILIPTIAVWMFYGV